MLGVADRQRGFYDAAWCSDLLREDSIYSLLAEQGDGSSATRTSPSATRGARAAPRSRRACWRRCSCSPTARGSPTSARWRRFASICAGRWRSTCRSNIQASIRRASSAIAPGSCSTARSGSSSSVRSSWPPSSACSRERPSRSSTRPRCSAPPRSRTVRPWCALGCEGSSTRSRPATKGPPRSSPRASLRLLQPTREAPRRLAGQGLARGAPRRGRKGRGAHAAGGRAGRRADRRRAGGRGGGCCARSSARSSRSKETGSRAPAGAAARAGSSPPRPRDAPRPHHPVTALHRIQAPRSGRGRGADPHRALALARE
jgi:hypothetical protein